MANCSLWAQNRQASNLCQHIDTKITRLFVSLIKMRGDGRTWRQKELRHWTGCSAATGWNIMLVYFLCILKKRLIPTRVSSLSVLILQLVDQSYCRTTSPSQCVSSYSAVIKFSVANLAINQAPVSSIYESTQRACTLKYVYFFTNTMDNFPPKPFFSTFSTLLAYIQVFHTPQEGV